MAHPRAPHPLVLPSETFHERLADALQQYEARIQRVGRGGVQSALVRVMAERWGSRAPTQPALSKWIRRESIPGVDYLWMLSDALGVRPAWLAFADGPMGLESEDEAKKRALLDEQERRHPPRTRRESTATPTSRRTG